MIGITARIVIGFQSTGRPARFTRGDDDSPDDAQLLEGCETFLRILSSFSIVGLFKSEPRQTGIRGSAATLIARLRAGQERIPRHFYCSRQVTELELIDCA